MWLSIGILFALLSPGILFTLGKGSRSTAAVIHSIIFILVINLFYVREPFQTVAAAQADYDAAMTAYTNANNLVGSSRYNLISNTNLYNQLALTLLGTTNVAANAAKLAADTATLDASNALYASVTAQLNADLNAGSALLESKQALTNSYLGSRYEGSIASQGSNLVGSSAYYTNRAAQLSGSASYMGSRVILDSIPLRDSTVAVMNDANLGSSLFMQTTDLRAKIANDNSTLAAGSAALTTAATRLTSTQQALAAIQATLAAAQPLVTTPVPCVLPPFMRPAGTVC